MAWAGSAGLRKARHGLAGECRTEREEPGNGVRIAAAAAEGSHTGPGAAAAHRTVDAGEAAAGHRGVDGRLAEEEDSGRRSVEENVPGEGDNGPEEALVAVDSIRPAEVEDIDRAGGSALVAGAGTVLAEEEGIDLAEEDTVRILEGEEALSEVRRSTIAFYIPERHSRP